jgi:subtilisin family serine protease
LGKIEILNVALLEVEEGEEESFIKRVQSRKDVYYAERNKPISLLYAPNDYYWSRQWGLPMINCPTAWDHEKGSHDVYIAIIDTGIDYTHDEFFRVFAGYDWVNNDDDPMDDHGHGTWCAGIAAAVMDNNIGIAGVAQVHVFAEKVIDRNGYGTQFNAARGILHAARYAFTDVISMSIGWHSSTITLRAACSSAYRVHRKILVAASGNKWPYSIDYPARYPTVIAVGAIDQNRERCWFSNYGRQLELVAPGVDIISTWRGNRYLTGDGTSAACPHVSGVAALVKSAHPSWSNIRIRQKLKNTAIDIGSPGWDRYTGHGIVNAKACYI